jgi:hypothetical protein
MRLNLIRKLAKRILFFLLALFAIFLIAVLCFVLRCHSVPAHVQPVSEGAKERKKITAAIKDYSRPEDNTFLTYPEWYIVWSYQEKADFQEKHLPSGFPFFGSIRQYWSGYCCAYGLVRDRYPFNAGDHLMLIVIGSSFSGEYAIRGIYENTIGRLTEWLSSNQPVEEDLYAYRVAREYADFVHIRPFYEFSFLKRLRGLWSQTSLWGNHPARKWERKAFLTLDYGIESFYTWIIEKATHGVYGVEEADTYAWIENAPSAIFTENPRIRLVKADGPNSFLVIIPRYQEFTAVASHLARRDVHFVEIAGNGQVLVTAIVPRPWIYNPAGGEFLFSTDILTQPSLKRIALRTPVRSLHTVLNDLAGRGLRVEHVYDF